MIFDAAKKTFRMTKKLLLSAIFILFCFQIFSQNTYGIDFNPIDRNFYCDELEDYFNNSPKELRTGIFKEDNKLFFYTNGKDFFNKIFEYNYDGLAVDIVPRSLYKCSDVDNRRYKTPKGYLTKPVYKVDLDPKKDYFLFGKARLYVGDFPESLQNEDVEFNILFIKNKRLCRYYSTYNLDSYPWELLDMGMYLDTLVYKNHSIKQSKEGEVLNYKTLKFTIPFKKNKATYLKSDIKPLYDSLKLTTYDIRKIKINAYSSVEGSYERNLVLQRQRAQSIVRALQHYQNSKIETEIITSENWVDFLNDITSTEYAVLEKYDKQKIKNRLNTDLKRKIENLLSRHRKAVIELSLEKKDKFNQKSVDEVVKIFNKAIADDNLKTAQDAQNSLFNRLKRKYISPEVLNKLNIPRQVKYAAFINQNSVNKFFSDKSYLKEVYEEFRALDVLKPNDKKIQYNLTALAIELMKMNAKNFSENFVIGKIEGLSSYGISDRLINRMKVNFHIARAEKKYFEQNYKEKDRSINFIKETYENIDLLDYDYLSLAQFFVHFSNIEDAIELLEHRVTNIEADEDLIFYYLNLTIVNEAYTSTPHYRKLMLNALNMNKKRFCKLFNSKDKGGVTFQLLEDDYLKKVYCENCNEN